MDNLLSKLDEIADFFDSTVRVNELQNPSLNLKKYFSKLLDDHGQSYGLVAENSVYKSNFTNVVSRVKTKDSFREKLIRKNLGIKLIKDAGITISPDKKLSNKDQNNILPIIKLYDDIIGIRIVCDLRKDCPKVLTLLKDHIYDLEKEGIVFAKNELENQPQTMKNGLEIYRLKAEYKGLYGFELQIKSKIEEAWGELDHFMFYKDHSFFSSKDIVQKTMNKVGLLFEEIENLLFELRNERRSFLENLEFNSFSKKFEDHFSLPIKEKFGFPYNLDRIKPFFFFLEKKGLLQDLAKVKLKVPQEISFSNAKFNSIIDQSFELKIIHWIYMNIISAESDFKNHLIEHLKNSIQNKVSPPIEGDLITKIFNQAIEFEVKHTIITSPPTWVDTFNEKGELNDHYTEYFDEIDYSDDPEKVTNELALILISLRNEGKVTLESELIQYKEHHIAMIRRLESNDKFREKEGTQKFLKLLAPN